MICEDYYDYESEKDERMKKNREKLENGKERCRKDGKRVIACEETTGVAESFEEISLKIEKRDECCTDLCCSSD